MSEESPNRKTAYAIQLLKTPDDPFKAACAVEPNTGLALKIVHEWTNDPFVLAEKERLLSEEGAKAFLPSKESFARDVYELAKSTIYDAKDRISAFRLYGEIMGFIEKPGVVVNNNTQSNRVMVVNNVGSNEEWERKLEKQQQRLIESAGSC